MGVAVVALLAGIIGIIVRIVPDAIYVHDVTADDSAYLILYKDTVLTSYGDMVAESVVENQDGEMLVLKYKTPGEKGGNFRRVLNITGDTAALDGVEYSRVSSWNVFQPALYQTPFAYFLTIFLMR